MNRLMIKYFVCALVSAGYLFTSLTPCLGDTITIFTPNKTAITAYHPSEMSEDAIAQKDREYEMMIEDHHWDAVIEKSSTNQYNCHGYAWHMASGGEAVEIDDEDISHYWLDGSYRQIEKSEAASGDIIVMTDPQRPDSLHSAVIVDAQWCRSKWADGPLVLHRWDDHPFGKEYRYFRRARPAAPAAPTHLRIVIGQ
jgi:hypothetical protein